MKNQTNKSKKIELLEKSLKFFSSLIIKKYEPRVVSITGSVGKTSSKEAIYQVLSSRFKVRKNEKNYNNEIGLPLTIIGAESGGRSLLKWTGVFLRALGTWLFPVKYPEVLVLEMGADRPGDIRYLTSLISSEAAVLTDVSGSHLEYFGTLEKVAEEKWTIVENLPAEGYAAINLDNPLIAKHFQNNKKNIKFLTFGFSEQADIQAQDVFYNYAGNADDSQNINGLSFKLNYKGTTLPIRLNNILGRHNIYAAMAGIAVGIAFKMNLVEIASALENFSMPSGRMNLIAGVKKTHIIDDTYNSSTVSALAALEVLGQVRSGRKIAVMGDMLELGPDSEAGHRSVAKKFLDIRGDIFLAVGSRMAWAADELRKHKIKPERLMEFKDPLSAAKSLERIIQKGDLILVKGSQGMRMEKVVEEIMADPSRTAELLCRQSEDWKVKPWKEV